MTERPREPWPSWKQTLIMLIGGTVLAASSCFGFILSLDVSGAGKADQLRGAVTMTLAVVFGLSVIAFLIGIIMLLMKFLRLLFAASRRPGEPTP